MNTYRQSYTPENNSLSVAKISGVLFVFGCAVAFAWVLIENLVA